LSKRIRFSTNGSRDVDDSPPFDPYLFGGCFGMSVFGRW
jgi:hypothetical protein